MFGRVALLIYLYYNAWFIVIICGFMVLEIIRFFFFYINEFVYVLIILMLVFIEN